MKSNKSWIEITNPVHGGEGWEFGAYLWSPVFDKAGNRKWEMMSEVNFGDFVYHFLKSGSQPYYYIGRSRVSGHCEEVKNEPPIPEQWAGRSPYYRIPLSSYVENVKPIKITDLIVNYKSIIGQCLTDGVTEQFFVEYGKEKEIRLAQKYLRKVAEPIEVLLDKEAKLPKPTMQGNFEPTKNEPPQPDQSPPGNVKTVITRIIRDTKLTRQIKKKFNWKCVICGESITLPNKNSYAEAHHLKPLGRGHKGLDNRENIIVLCPIHHTEFDYGCIAIDPNSKKILHIDQENKYNRKSLCYDLDYLDISNLKYHFDNFEFKKSQ